MNSKPHPPIKPPSKIQLMLGDITQVKADAIVNAANPTLLGGGGVDGAIHAAAGPQLLAKCRTLNGCLTSQAKITSGYRLPAKFVIHTVGPVWQGGTSGEAKLLTSCYLNSLKLADSQGVKTLAFPAISTGVYGYPKKAAARIAIQTVKDYLSHSKLEKVIFVLHSSSDHQLYQRTLSQRS